MGMNQPPMSPQQQEQAPQGDIPSGAHTDPSMLQYMVQNGDVHQMEQQMANENQMGGQDQQDQQDQQEPPDPIVSYDDAIDAVLKLIVNTAERDLELQVQSKAIYDFASAVKTLQEAAIPQIDPRAQLELQYQQQEAQGKQQDQQMTMQQQMHEQALQHKQQLHDQQLQMNDRNQALKEWQAQQQFNHQAENQDQQTMQNMMNMGQQHEKHQQAMDQQQQNQQQEKKSSTDTTK